MEGLDIAVINKLLEVGRLSAGPQMVSGANVPYVMTEEGPVLLPDLIYNDFEKQPKRIKNIVAVNDPASFVEYFNLFKDDNSRIFADESKRSVRAILDYHKAGTADPRWAQHKLVLQLVHSPEWVAWSQADNRKFTQTEFGEFLEQHAIDITKPRPADIIEIANDLQAKSEMDFGQAQKSNDGSVVFKYTETVKATVGGNQMAVPDRFLLELPVFVGGADVKLEALLRFRVNAGKLTIWFTLVRPEECVRAAFSDSRAQIAQELGLVIINGTVGE